MLFLSSYYCLKCSWLEVFQMPHEKNPTLNVWLVFFPEELLDRGIHLASKKSSLPNSQTKGCEQESKVQLNPFVDTTLLILGEPYFLLDSKHWKSRSSQPTTC